MIELIFATNNKHKVDEFQLAVENRIKIITLAEAGIDIDIPEPYDNLEANASEKSRIIHQLSKKSCFGEDTALEVEALNGQPGVRSARYAGNDRDFEKNIDRLLAELTGISHRRARFRTVISLIYGTSEHLFEGICEGTIGYSRQGDKGFGYDAVFTPTGSDKTFAEMTPEDKNAYSHRRKASDRLVSFLQQVDDGF